MNNEPLTINYEPVIGLEVHVELKTKSKMFCSCSADYFGQKPNTHTCPVCLGSPGALPVPNGKAIDWCVMIGLALNCKIANFSKFDRKNYFYPDLPKGYQISQYDQPFCLKGFITLSNGKKIGITRVHMEEDTAKLTHQGENSLIDFNRSGVPLVEIVTEPDFENAKEVIEYLKKLQQIVRYLDVSDADMEKGNMRLEPNISLREITMNNELLTINNLPKYKVEVKNINSFRFAEKAIEYEIRRQTEILSENKTPVQETRGWDEDKQKTVSQRIKEEANDYRYFPEPDIPPIRFTQNQIRQLADQMPELPDAKLARLIKEYNLSKYDAEILTREKEMTDYFEEAVKVGKTFKINPKQIANTVINKKIDMNNILPAELVKNIVNFKKTDDIDENKLQEITDKVIKENQKAINDYKSGKVQVIGFLIGKVKQHFPTADSNQIKTALEKKLK
ncbi:MAG: Aspartyl/glutamyl-tRNA(Asn/Gln) amidotransferase subunit B [Candidatus Levybacteria bacterium GW2011_GWA2_37_36]|nr:MAG: Aspartyl/glutamyl-tRNA(Asn/Gln) amidotransferase subunit B [Candidatus Levybacteria bacterium GW2011_GWA1_37_16]KKQ32186.1 MAG: Aspartyl/glutamyl-tRNA(Asn/Gln) amidotransferase subunit B [Candidatus Levybacteria bacterium GW2011_GWA2_37_36]KKQ42060.1 MAG: Aspartyl/glutamyl-tRNA(Asn/Gln) amidotransferase subunit B [Candidatus Levybacteria bacterium GW2011_GWB1_37_8]